jgi:hypothetical protein
MGQSSRRRVSSRRTPHQLSFVVPFGSFILLVGVPRIGIEVAIISQILEANSRYTSTTVVLGDRA